MSSDSAMTVPFQVAVVMRPIVPRSTTFRPCPTTRMSGPARPPAPGNRARALSTAPARRRAHPRRDGRRGPRRGSGRPPRTRRAGPGAGRGPPRRRRCGPRRRSASPRRDPPARPPSWYGRAAAAGRRTSPPGRCLPSRWRRTVHGTPRPASGRPPPRRATGRGAWGRSAPTTGPRCRWGGEPRAVRCPCRRPRGEVPGCRRPLLRCSSPGACSVRLDRRCVAGGDGSPPGNSSPAAPRGSVAADARDAAAVGRRTGDPVPHADVHGQAGPEAGVLVVGDVLEHQADPEEPLALVHLLAGVLAEGLPLGDGQVVLHDRQQELLLVVQVLVERGRQRGQPLGPGGARGRGGRALPRLPGGGQGGDPGRDPLALVLHAVDQL